MRKKIQTEYPWGHSRPFNAYVNYLRSHYGARVQKLSVDAGFSCPNRDGTTGFGGCTFCDNAAFTPTYVQAIKPIKQQLEEGIAFQKVRYKNPMYVAYFQSFSNTYADVDTLRNRFSEALSVDGVEGLVIGTRPDCIDESKLSMIKELVKGKHVIIEYGVESCYDRTLKRINRGHDFAAAQKALALTKAFEIDSGAHFVFGLPGESREDMLQMVDAINKLPIKTVKFHQLQILKGTAMELEYKLNPDAFQLFNTREEYAEFLIELLPKLRPDILIERMAGEVSPDFLIAPDWGPSRYDQVLSYIENRLVSSGSYQGSDYQFSL